MNFLLRKLFRTIPPEKEAEFLTSMVSGSAYGIFLDRDFRRLVSFETQIQTEQDRIFNEVVVTALVLLISVIKDRLLNIAPSRRDFWETIYATIPDTFADWLAEIGVQESYVGIWRNLVNLRFEEYEEKQSWTRHAWIEEFLEDRKRNEEAFHDTMVRVETLTVSSMLHITRGKAKQDDPLRRYLRTWLGLLDNKLERRIGW